MKFLFLCTGNSCRSILSEVLFNSRAPHDWKAYSAGSKPALALEPKEMIDGLYVKNFRSRERKRIGSDS